MNRVLQAFEHDVIRMSETELSQDQFDALVKFNQTHGDCFFTVRHKALRLDSYVGVLQVGKLTIEILPKADRNNTSEKAVWRNALIGMLRYCGYLKTKMPTWAMLRLQKTTMLDLYLESFLSEADEIVRYGLTKKYRRTEGNVSSLKGRFVFSKQISNDQVHRELFFTDHDKYDWDNAFNWILKRATAIISYAATSSSVRSRAKYLCHSFEAVSNHTVSEMTFDKLRYNRKTERYRRAIVLAKLIIMNYQPDMRAGGNSVLALLVNMNDLFERYVFLNLKRAAAKRTGIEVKEQRSHLFWKSGKEARLLRPDIEISFSDNEKPLVLDTKWKVPKQFPSGSDLKQMFAYGKRLSTSKCILLYPRVDDRVDVDGGFESLDNEPQIECSMRFVRLLNDSGFLSTELGDELLALAGL